jgi:putative SOS response-associated peptidase YedK
MCNLYSVTTNVEALRQLVRTFEVASDIGNLEPIIEMRPDYFAPIIRNRDGLRELTKAARWGMPSSSRALYEAARARAQKLQQKQGRDLTPDEFNEIVRMEPDRGTTNVRNVDSQHWKRWLTPEFRCLVPFNSFSEFDGTEAPGGGKKGDTWFAFDADRPLAFFAGIWVPQWTSVRKIKEGVVTTDLFAFLTCEPNDVVGSIHMKAMPVILTTPDEAETWLTAPWSEAKSLQRPLPQGVLRIVAVGTKQDGRPEFMPAGEALS